jgi:hypothetical protein
MVVRQTNNRYPRRGERLAPQTLREFLLEPVPAAFCELPAHAALRLCDLDETAWQQFRPETLAALGALIVERVATYHVRKIFQYRHFPRPPQGVQIDDLRLENRTRRCLMREGLDGDLAALGNHTIGDVLAMRAFGPRCLVDLLSALESPRWRSDNIEADELPIALCRELTAAAEHLGALSEARLIHREDPRFALLMEGVDVEAVTAADMAARLLARRHDPPDTTYVAAQVRELADRIASLPHRTIEQELKDIFAPAGNERNRQILVGYYGWDDGRQHTLTEIGKRYGITRERIRQVCAKLTRKPKGLPVFVAPAIDRALDLIHGALPRSAEGVESQLCEAGLTSIGMRLENVATAARLLERTADFRVVVVEHRRLAVTTAQAELPAAIIDIARKELYFHGLTTIKRIERLTAARFPGRGTAALVAETLQLLEGFAWLDRGRGWFRLESVHRHGLPKTIDKILSVAHSITLADLREALARNRRLWKDPPPTEVLREFCRQTPGVRVENDRISSDPPRDWRTALTGVEAKLVATLQQYGPVMERNEFEDLCVSAGVNRFSFHAFVSWSPVIKQFGHSVYGLLGASPTSRQIEALATARRMQRVNHRVLDDHGRTDDGKVWLSYRLSKAASTYAVVTIPAALKDDVHGRFELLGPDGLATGVLATKDGRAWGLGALLRQQGARIGDHVIVTLDLERRTARLDWRREPVADGPVADEPAVDELPDAFHDEEPALPAAVELP